MSKDMSHKQFLAKLETTNINYKNGNFTVISEYVDYITPLIIKDSNGLLHSMRSSSLFSGGFPKFQTALDKTLHLEEELKRTRKDFENGDLTIVGEFKDKDIRILIKDKYGVTFSNISELRKGNIPTIESAINKEDYFSEILKEKNLEIYNQVKIKKYINCGKVIMDYKYGEIKGSVKDILKWKYIGIISAVDKAAFWVKRNKDIVDDYCNTDYSLAEYKNNKTKVKLRCKKHNICYKQAANHHIENEKGCPKCAHQIIRYTDSTVETNREFFSNIDGYFYILRLYNENEVFYKAGICAKYRIDYRMNAIKRFYQVELIYKKEMDMVEAYKMEQKILKEFKHNFKYEPEIKFKGYTECLIVNPIPYIYS